MAYTAIKYTKSNASRLIANRLHVKTFKSMNELGEFLCKQKDNTWQEWAPLDASAWPTKAGVYRFAGGAWHNEKSLDASVLAHI